MLDFDCYLKAFGMIIFFIVYAGQFASAIFYTVEKKSKRLTQIWLGTNCVVLVGLFTHAIAKDLCK